jgi:hypothetical protein
LHHGQQEVEVLICLVPEVSCDVLGAAAAQDLGGHTEAVGRLAEFDFDVCHLKALHLVVEQLGFVLIEDVGNLIGGFVQAEFFGIHVLAPFRVQHGHRPTDPR